MSFSKREKAAGTPPQVLFAKRGGREAALDHRHPIEGCQIHPIGGLTFHRLAR
jgi:hypothetical protein